MRKTLLKTLGISAAAAAFAMLGYAAQAQAQATNKEVPKAAAKVAPKKKAPPACKTLKAEAACEARADCRWVSASIDPKTKKQKKAAYCQSKPKAPAKKAPAKKAEPKK